MRARDRALRESRCNIALKESNITSESGGSLGVGILAEIWWLRNPKSRETHTTEGSPRDSHFRYIKKIGTGPDLQIRISNNQGIRTYDSVIPFNLEAVRFCEDSLGILERNVLKVMRDCYTVFPNRCCTVFILVQFACLERFNGVAIVDRHELG